jgi:hypothetical protein
MYAMIEPPLIVVFPDAVGIQVLLTLFEVRLQLEDTRSERRMIIQIETDPYTHDDVARIEERGRYFKTLVPFIPYSYAPIVGVGYGILHLYPTTLSRRVPTQVSRRTLELAH